MKKSKIIYCLLLLVCFLPNAEVKADSDKKILDYLIRHLNIYYVMDYNDPSAEVYLLNCREISKGDTTTAAGDFWHNPRLRHARTLVESLLRPSKDGGDYSLQRTSYDIMKIQDKYVQVWIYNDKAKMNRYARRKYKPCRDDDDFVWPCAGDFGNNYMLSKFMAGYMHLGVKNMNIHGKAWTKATFIHELMHTQDRANIRAHVFYSSSAKKWYHYGVDGDHFFKEAVPSITSAYKEAIANTLSLIFDSGLAERSFKWFANNGDLWIETTQDSNANDIPTNAWLYNRINEVAGPGTPIPGRPNYRAYKIRDLPARFIIHNEMIIAMILSEYGVNVNDYKFLKAVKKTNKELDGKSSSIATIFKNMCEAGLPKGETAATVLKTDAPKTYLLPLAYVDYFTGYNAKTAKEFNAIFENKMPRLWVNMYWNHGRETVRKRAPIDDPTHKPVKGDLTDIAMALGIIENEAEDLSNY